MIVNTHDFNGWPIIVGGGVAGLMTAIHLAPDPVLLLSKCLLGTESSSGWAQGGLAASFGHDDDPMLHLADTLSVGDGLCDGEVAQCILSAAPSAIQTLVRLGVKFDRASDGSLLLGLEAAHGRRRIVHATGDRTGEEIMRALVEAVRKTPSIVVIEEIDVRRLLVEDNTITGVIAQGREGNALFKTQRVVLATGGIGGLFHDSTNPPSCFGEGLALATRAGAELADLEFIQFHPTAFDGLIRPMPLISEAVRGEGAVIIDETGHRFLDILPNAELAPRDILARAIWMHLVKKHRVFIDVRNQPGLDFAHHFPAIASFCKAAGFDPKTQPIPIRPAQHYHMGGIAVNQHGQSTVAGLWACGEVVSTGLHGANRLASNSLIEAIVCAKWVAESVMGTSTGLSPQPLVTDLPLSPDPSCVRPVISQALGVLRCAEELSAAASVLLPLAIRDETASDPTIVGLMLVIAALQREESRGAHHRTDFSHPCTYSQPFFASSRQPLWLRHGSLHGHQYRQWKTFEGPKS